MSQAWAFQPELSFDPSALAVGVVLQVFEEALVALLGGDGPPSVDGCDGLVRGEGIGGDDAGEVSIADHFDAGNFFSGGGVDGFELCIETVGAEDGAEDHAGAKDVGREEVFAGDEIAAIDLGDWGSGDFPFGSGG